MPGCQGLNSNGQASGKSEAQVQVQLQLQHKQGYSAARVREPLDIDCSGTCRLCTLMRHRQLSGSRSILTCLTTFPTLNSRELRAKPSEHPVTLSSHRCQAGFSENVELDSECLHMHASMTTSYLVILHSVCFYSASPMGTEGAEERQLLSFWPQERGCRIRVAFVQILIPNRFLLCLYNVFHGFFDLHTA